MQEPQQNKADGVSPEASSSSASSGTHWAYEKYFTALRPEGQTPGAPVAPLYDIDSIATKLLVEDEDDLGDDGKPLVIKIKS